MTTPARHVPILPPPKPGIHNEPNEIYRHLYEMWRRTGGYQSQVYDLSGLEVTAVQLNTLIDIHTDDTVQQQLNTKSNTADLGGMAFQEPTNVAITGGTIANCNINNNTMSIRAGNSAVNIRLGGTLRVDNTPVGNVGAGEDTLITYAMAANTLSSDKQYLEISAWGTVAANANSKTIKLHLGSTELLTTGAVAANSGSWQINCQLVRSAAASEQSIAKIISSNALIIDSATFLDVTEDLTTNLNIFCTGEGTTTDDVIQKGLIIKWFDFEE